MSTSFKVLPSNYTGVTGSTMPVRAELQGGEVQGCPVGESFYSKGVGHDGEPFTNGDLVQSDLTTPFEPFTITAEGYIGNAAVTESICRFKPVSYDGESPFTVSVEFDIKSNIDTFSFTDFFFDNMQSLSGVDLIMDGSTAFFKLANSSAITRQTPSHPEWFGQDISVSAKHTHYGLGARRIEYLFSGGGITESLFVEYTSISDISYPFNISYWVGRSLIVKSVLIVGQGLPNQCQGELETYNVELFDNLGVSRDTQVVTGGEVQGCPIGEQVLEPPFQNSDFLQDVEPNEDGVVVTNTLLQLVASGVSDVKSIKNTSSIEIGDYIPNETEAYSVYFDGIKLFAILVNSGGVDDFKVYGGVGVALGDVPVPSHTEVTFISDLVAVGGVLTGEVSIVVGGNASVATVTSPIVMSGVGVFGLQVWNRTDGLTCSMFDTYVVGNGFRGECTGETTGKASYIYDAPNMQSVDTGEWKLVADGAVEAPFQVAIVTEGANTITQGDTTVEVITLDGSGVDIALDMERGVDSRGLVQWLDNGKEYDNYKNSFSVRSETPQSFELLMNSDSVDSVEISTPIKEGFFPFGMGFATEQNYPVNINTWEIEAQTYHGEVKDYSVTAYPNVRDIYSSLIESTTLSGCVLDHWQIAGVPFPFMQPDNDHNDMRFTSVGHGDSYQVVDPTREYGESASFTIEVEEEQARLILQFFTKVMRGTEQTATFPASYNLFSRRYEGLTTATVKLFSNVVKVLHISQGRVEINFSLQIVGV